MVFKDDENGYFQGRTCVRIILIQNIKDGNYCDDDNGKADACGVDVNGGVDGKVKDDDHPDDDDGKDDAGGVDEIWQSGTREQMGCGRLRSNETWIKPPNQNAHTLFYMLCYPRTKHCVENLALQPSGGVKRSCNTSCK